jgi:carboxypeptidase C (cathepsin A)
MEWSGKEKFNAAKDESWKVKGKKAGEYRVYEGLSFLKVYEAGHMVPFDQPEASLQFINHFIGMGKKGKRVDVSDKVVELK